MDYASTHRDIIEKCKQGNREAQFELYRLYARQMYNVCLRMVKREVDAEDLLQNSFIDIFTKLDTFKYQSSIGAWIKKIVINNCINFLKRKRMLIQELDENYGHDGHLREERDDQDTALSIQLIQKAMLELPNGYRVVFSLYAFEGYDHKEIAHILGISEATSKSQYSRAKQKIRSIINKNYWQYAAK